MNPILKMIVDALLKYLESHPDEVELLVQAAVNAILVAIKSSQTK